MSTEEKITFFSELMKTCHNLYLWGYDETFRLQFSSCPDEKGIGTLFSLEAMQPQILSAFEESNHPVILTNSLGLMWTAAVRKETALNSETDSSDDCNAETMSRTDPAVNDSLPASSRGIYILGPYFIDDSAGASIRRSLHAMHLSGHVLENTLSFLRTLPVISLSKAVEYSVMLHYTLTGETIRVSDLRYLDAEQKKDRGSGRQEDLEANIHGTYEKEQEMLRMVREGDLDISRKIGQMLNTGTVGKLAGNPNRQYKNAVLVGIVLFSRAAIEGGLSPELSMNLCDRYFRGVEAAQTVSELADVNRTMQNDYARRVHEIREHEQHSAQVRAVNAYVDLHLEEPIHLSEMAKALGYTTYYLSRKYQKASGETISEHIRKRRIDRAKELLQNSSLPIYEIAGRLCFSSPSYFTGNFKKEVGMTPAEYRNQYGHLI